MNLNNKSRHELLEIKHSVDERLIMLDREQREQAISDLHDLAKSRGFNLDDLLSKNDKTTRFKAPAKYRNPETGKEWSGRGRRPAWLSGETDLSKFEIIG